MSWEKILSTVGNVKLRGGIFGKMTWAIMLISICVTALAYRSDNLYILSATILIMMIFAFYFFNRLLNFAEKYPQIAIMDGAEFLVHEQIVHAAKGLGPIPIQTNVVDHAQPDMERASIEADDTLHLKKIEGK